MSINEKCNGDIIPANRDSTIQKALFDIEEFKAAIEDDIDTLIANHKMQVVNNENTAK